MSFDYKKYLEDRQLINAYFRNPTEENKAAIAHIKFYTFDIETKEQLEKRRRPTYKYIL